MKRAQAVWAQDMAGAMASVAPDILSFDVVNPLQNVGAEAARQRVTDWFTSWQSATLNYELRNLSISAGDDVAFCHSLNHVNGTKTDGQKIDMWWRATVCFCKIEGQWLATHEHSSVPFDTENGMASLGLKP